MCTSPILFAPLKKCIHNTTSKCTFRQTGLIHTVIQNLGILHCFVIWTMVVTGHKQTNDGQTVFEKGAYFFPASGVIFRAWPHIHTSKFCLSFYVKKYLLGAQTFSFLCTYLYFLCNKILCYDARKLLHNST